MVTSLAVVVLVSVACASEALVLDPISVVVLASVDDVV